MGVSSDPDDAFMTWGWVSRRVSDPHLPLEVEYHDTSKLNLWALEGGPFDLQVVSAATFFRLDSRWTLLGCGASFGFGTGPIVVSRSEGSKKGVVGTPGRTTTAHRLWASFVGNFEEREYPFFEIVPALRRGEVDQGILIHEAQLSYASEGLVKVLDLGEEWAQRTGLPLPLGVFVARSDLGEILPRVEALFQRSLAEAWSHPKEALEYAQKFSRSSSPNVVKEFIRLYVNSWTFEMGEGGRRSLEALRRFLGEGLS